MRDNIVLYQSHWRRAVAQPTPELKRTNWVDRVLGLVDPPQTTALVIVLPVIYGAPVFEKRVRLEERLDVAPPTAARVFRRREPEFGWPFTRRSVSSFRGNAVILQFPFKPLAILRNPRKRLQYKLPPAHLLVTARSVLHHRQ